MAYAASMQSSNHENTVIPELREKIAAAADTTYVDNAIANAITTTLNTEV